MNSEKTDMIKVGKALLALGLQNTHCGNISVRVGDDVYITKTGSMKGHLTEGDIVEPGLYEPKSGLFQASSETGSHIKILEYADSVIHAHSLPATLVSYYLEEFNPIDFLGKKHIGSIPVVEFKFPIGSKEMDEKIHEVLRDHCAMIIKTHGPIVRSSNIYESFFLMNITDYSSEIRVDTDMLKIPREKLPMLTYPQSSDYPGPKGRKETADEELVRIFKMVASDMFHMRLSPFHTGSISVRDGKEMLFSPGASTPDYIDNDIYRINIKESVADYFYNLHQAVYRYSHAQAAVFTHSPLALVQGFRVLAKGEDRIIPVDAEGGYLYPAIPVVLPDEAPEKIVQKAERYKMVLISGIGVLAIGHTPTHCIHHNSSLKNISYLKNRLEMMEKAGIIDNIDRFLDKRGKEW